ncbi:MAG: hypothetical protein COV74_09450 [Candidatus Omnitrophica bacterium CG11_big_fil_rev_8_21_14_0_20_45_26]|uniref:Winged helix-turn-helix domain-containing protein n=1 Tax=Candidatus Abzuiibacterium crystallinum TaxID=1974748 RepID=A0A2H0LLK6_9BACT|nr:MAG: hypothetical protein COV74_09450 [Candidatus Omnitrophica bacterium CG11_big_fil_rev_8_21_14_0_20_45_26]PIW63568.1 MAG: hypothetical protein COW12_09995 [Candidatus Omnitrophica bacterium CG12_big_fil_rev_8_21_14_0_65_45_16]
MITEIGITAGEIWHYLDKHGSADLATLENGISRPKELLLMSLGWLAREGHISLGDEKSGFSAKLNPQTK